MEFLKWLPIIIICFICSTFVACAIVLFLCALFVAIYDIIIERTKRIKIWLRKRNEK